MRKKSVPKKFTPKLRGKQLALLKSLAATKRSAPPKPGSTPVMHNGKVAFNHPRYFTPKEFSGKGTLFVCLTPLHLFDPFVLLKFPFFLFSRGCRKTKVRM